MNSIIISHIVYITVSIGMTIWVGRTLFANGQIFINDAFHGNEEMGQAVNHLLIVGFYLLNIGFIALHLSSGYGIETAAEVIEHTANSLGGVLFVLGAIHYFNMFNIARMRRKAHRGNNRKGETTTPMAGSQTLTKMI
ncbi:MAG: hypothetical protein ACPG8W_20025 [Candidatus Promineifilaceae bacterium]